jgi:hypothetical protein
VRLPSVPQSHRALQVLCHLAACRKRATGSARWGGRGGEKIGEGWAGERGGGATKISPGRGFAKQMVLYPISPRENVFVTMTSGSNCGVAHGEWLNLVKSALRAHDTN